MKLLVLLAVLVSNMFAQARDYEGWVSDSDCSLARASGGQYTGTSPECARRCLKEGRRMVLIIPGTKTILAAENPQTLVSQVGNKVRLSGMIVGTRLHVNQVQLIEENRSECERPPMKN